MSDLIQRALKAKRESKYIDFKGSLDFAEPHSWCEIVKDIIAMANSGGGVLLIGLDNMGKPTGFDPASILSLDDAVVTDRIRKYTGVQFDAFTISEETKAGKRLAAILIDGVSIPIVFTSPGTYAVSDKKQKTAFSVGTVYFRHGAKSEPGTTDDLRKAMERQLESIRHSWLQGVRKIVKAPPGSQVYTFPSSVEVRESASPGAKAIRIVDDPDAPAYRKMDYDATHPYRQGDVINLVNEAISGRGQINSYDIQCVRQLYEIADDDTLCHRSKFSLTSQYTQKFVDWLIEKFNKDKRFFARLRKEAYDRRH